MNLSTPINGLPRVGPFLISRLNSLGIHTVLDLIYYFPFRYDDFSKQTTITEVQVGESVTLNGQIWAIKNVYTRTRKVLTQAILNDGTNTIEIVWFNQPWLTKNISVGDNLRVSGKIGQSGSKLNLVSPVWEKMASSEWQIADSKDKDSENHQPSAISHTSIHTGRLVPVYPETVGVNSKWLRNQIHNIFPIIEKELEDPLPDFIKKDLLDLRQSIKQVHFPDDLAVLKKARSRLGFDELFYVQLVSAKVRSEWQKKPLVKAWTIDQSKIDKFIKSLPFELTGAQLRVSKELIEDLKKERPMNRLMQGEVGSGKTVVGAILIYIAHLNGLKSLLMAPTEVLAFQHFETLQRLLSPYKIEIGIYTGSKKSMSKASLLTSQNVKGKKQNTESVSDVVVGTHALLSKNFQLDNVGLVVVDEQQRFGVEQRAILRNSASVPHFLTMTATPIPRTVALTVYGDLDLSVIDELPKERVPIRTHFVPNKKRADAYKFIADRVKEGDQVFIITPLIELSETLVTAKAAKAEWERLQRDIFPKLKLGLLHGRLPSKEKQQVIEDFKNKKYHILISTSVVEVGVDIPNATIMVIEGAERFGLAQLHQMRGRVGRGAKKSYCLLFSENENPQIVNRLKHLEKTFDGLKLAELDLKIRGSGDIFGTRQSGRLEFKIADFSDLQMIERARSSVVELLQKDSTLDKYPQIKVKLSKLAGNVAPD